MKEEFIKLMAEYGYVNQQSVAKAINAKASYFNGRSTASTAAYLNYVINEKRRISNEMADAWLLLTKNDSRLESLIAYSRNLPSTKKETHEQSSSLETVLDSYFSVLNNSYSSMNEVEQLEVLHDVSTLLQKYVTRKKRLYNEER